jgi:cell wall-associated NlpC family hydrolase
MKVMASQQSWRSNLAALLLLTPMALPAQEVSVSAGRWLTSSHVSEYRLGIGGIGMGPVRLRYSAQFLEQAGESQAHWYGAGADLILRPTSLAQPYLIVGAALGAGRGRTGGGEQPGLGLWGGIGAELLTFAGIGLQAEAQYSRRSGVGLEGLAFALKIGSRYGSAVAAAAPPPLLVPRANPEDEEAIRLATVARTSRAPAAAIVGTALSAMGTPYRWGGTGLDGFDCSGLIQYAYAQHGITLVRRSTDQARAGTEVARELEALEPGDILTFSADPGGSVQHVGLYVGEGRFIHSARGGVQISQLSAADPVGKWWFDRWAGARRLL